MSHDDNREEEKHQSVRRMRHLQSRFAEQLFCFMHPEASPRMHPGIDQTSKRLICWEVEKEHAPRLQCFLKHAKDGCRIMNLPVIQNIDARNCIVRVLWKSKCIQICLMSILYPSLLTVLNRKV